MTASAASTPAAAARLVTTTISAKRPPTAARVEPGLKPNQPSQRMNTPRPTSGIECPGIARGLPSESYLPRRGPDAHRAEQRELSRRLLCRVAHVEEPAVGAGDRARAAEGQRKAGGPVGDRADRVVGQDLHDTEAGVLRTREADLQEQESRLH